MPFGAFVEIVPGKEGLVHVSEMAPEYVNDPNDVVKVGQAVKVRVKEVDEQGRLNLSMVFGEQAEGKKEEQRPPRPNQRVYERREQEYRQQRGSRDNFRKRRH